MTLNRKILVACLALGAAGAAWYGFFQRSDRAGADAAADAMARFSARAVRRDIEAAVVVSGHVRPVLSSEIKAEVSGKVARIHVADGRAVRKGDVLVELDPTLPKADQEEAARNLQLQRLNVEKLARDRSRTEALRAKEFVSEKDLEDAVTAHEIGKLQLQVAQARLDKAEENLRKTSIRAPYDGVATDIGVLEGDVVIGAQSINNGTTLLKVSEISPLRVDVNLNEFDATRVAVGSEAELTFDSLPGVRRPGKVTFLASFGTSDGKDKDVRIFPCQVSFEAGMGVRPGISANARIRVASAKGCVAVPVSAIFIEEADRFVYVRKGEGWDRRNVKLGLADEGWTQVVSGIDEGDVVSLVRPSGAR